MSRIGFVMFRGNGEDCGWKTTIFLVKMQTMSGNYFWFFFSNYTHCIGS
jgi:hypothetical protein